MATKGEQLWELHRRAAVSSLVHSAIPAQEGPWETHVTTADTSISYMRSSDLLLKDSKDSGKSEISGISYGKLGPSG